MIQIGIATIIYSFGQMRVLVLVEKKKSENKNQHIFHLKKFLCTPGSWLGKQDIYIKQ